MDEAVQHGLVQGALLCDVLVAGLEARESSTFSVRAMEAESVVTRVEILSGVALVKEAGSARVVVQRILAGEPDDGQASWLRAYFWELVCLFHLEPRGLE